MSFRPRGLGARSHRRRRETLVDLTPLIDIVFQLLIFFLLTATFQETPSFKVKLPKAKNTDVNKEAKAVMVTLGSDGSYGIDGKVVDSAELELRLCAAAQGESTGVSIKADADTPHRYVVEVMGFAKSCGLEKLNILHGR
ncbi:MAG: ExbD/TolR family protein [Nannocystales bacterium]